MSVRRLLLAAGGGASFESPAHLVSLASSVASWGITVRRAFTYNGATYAVADDGTNGDIVLTKHVHATRTTTTSVIDAAYERESHATPAVLVRPDGKIVVAYSKHNGDRIKRWISTNAEDITAGTAAVGVTGVNQATYCSLVQLLDVTGDPIYWFYRDRPTGTTGQIEYVTSTDGLDNWSGLTNLYYSTTDTPYWTIASDNSRYIHFFPTNREPNEAGSYVYHFYIDGTTGKRYKSDGTEITASLPITASNCTLVYQGVGGIGYAFAASGCVDAATGYPAVLIRAATDSGQTDNQMLVARWTGSAWQVDEVATTDGIITTFVYSPWGAIHPTDPDVVYLSRMVSGVAEVFRYTTSNSGATWTGVQLTSGSSGHNAYAEVPVNATDALEAIWTSGTWTSDLDYDLAWQGWSLAAN